MLAAAAVRIARVVAVLATCLALAAGSWLLAREPFLSVARPLTTDGPAALDSLPFDVVLTGGCATALLVCAGWVLGTSAVVAVAHLARLVAPGSPILSACARHAEAGCPRLARGAVVGVLGLGFCTALASPALADASGAPLDGLTVPDRSTGVTKPAARVLQVRPGDSLWSIASHLLPPGADDARVTRAWHALHRTNHARIGDDPDLILPGTRLVVPDLAAPHREEHP